MPRQTNKQNSFPLSGDGEWHTDGSVVVGKYTKTRQRLLRAKIIKSGHDRYYKRSPLPCIGKEKYQGIRNFKNKKYRTSIKKKK